MALWTSEKSLYLLSSLYALQAQKRAGTDAKSKFRSCELRLKIYKIIYKISLFFSFFAKNRQIGLPCLPETRMAPQKQYGDMLSLSSVYYCYIILYCTGIGWIFLPSVKLQGDSVDGWEENDMKFQFWVNCSFNFLTVSPSLICGDVAWVIPLAKTMFWSKTQHHLKHLRVLYVLFLKT